MIYDFFVFYSKLLIVLSSCGCLAQQVNKGQVYRKKIALKNPIYLTEKVKETSGLLFWKNQLWTHNDDTDTCLYALSSKNGTVLNTYLLPHTTNTDWEEMAQDSTHLYIGDFGNNATGKRSDLHILKIEKKAMNMQQPNIETIAFSYANQNLAAADSRKNNFDCEAFVITQDSIFLFSKEWKSKKTTCYALPKQAGLYVAKPKKNFAIQGLVTGATYLENKKLLALCGYTRKGSSFVHLFYDFEQYNFFSGKNLRVNLKPRFHQIEGIATQDGLHYFVTNEKLDLKLFTVHQALYELDFSSFFAP